MKPPIDKPNRRTVEALLKDLACRSYYQGSDYQELEREMEALEESLHRDARWKRLNAKIKAARDAHYDRENDRVNKVRLVRLEYQAKGLTPAVLKKVEALVEEFANEM